MAIALSPPAESAFASVYRHESPFVRACLRRAKVGSGELDDLCQEVFVVAWRRRAEFSGERPARAWLFQTARRVAANHHRSQRRRGRREAVAAPASSEVLALQEQQVARGEAGALVEAFMSGLTPHERSLFELSEIEGETGPELARRLGLNLNTTYARIRSLRRRFGHAAALAALVMAGLALSSMSDCSIQRPALEVFSEAPAISPRSSVPPRAWQWVEAEACHPVDSPASHVAPPLDFMPAPQFYLSPRPNGISVNSPASVRFNCRFSVSSWPSGSRWACKSPIATLVYVA